MGASREVFVPAVVADGIDDTQSIYSSASSTTRKEKKKWQQKLGFKKKKEVSDFD